MAMVRTGLQAALPVRCVPRDRRVRIGIAAMARTGQGVPLVDDFVLWPRELVRNIPVDGEIARRLDFGQ